MKKALSLLAVLAIVLSACIMGVGTVAFAAEESSADDFLVFDGILEEYVGAGGDVVIPASLGIKEIASYAMADNQDITSVVIPEGVEVIGTAAFNQCKNIEQITLPYSLCELGEHVFSGISITEVAIPSNLTTIAYGTFSGCTYLTDVTISYGVQEIMPLAFQGTAMAKVIFPETVELICGGSSFGHNKNAEANKIEYYICNPDCEIGWTASNVNKALKYQWEKQDTPWNHNPGSATITIYCVKDSAVAQMEDTLKQWLYERDTSDGFRMVEKEQSFFDEMPENQEGYGIQEPAKDGTDGTVGNDTEPDNPSDGDGGKSGSTKNQSGSGSTQYVTQDGGNGIGTTLIIVICVFGGIMLIAIIAIVILAATGKLFGGKKRVPEVDIDAIVAAKLKELTEAKEESAEENKADAE